MLEFSLEQDYNVISKNAMSVEFLGTSYLGTRVLSLMRGVEDTVTSTVDLVNLKDLQKNLFTKGTNGKLLSGKMKETGYATMAGLPITIPLGLASGYTTYLMAMIRAGEFIKDSCHRTLEPTQKYLSWLTGAGGELAGTLPNQLSITSDLRKKELDEIKAMVGGCFDAKSQQSMANFGDRFDNVSDWDHACGLAEDFEVLLRGINFDKLKAESDAVALRSKSLRTRIEHDQGTHAVSGYMAGEISKILYNVADEIEFIGSYMQLSRTLCHTFQENVDSLTAKTSTWDRVKSLVG